MSTNDATMPDPATPAPAQPPVSLGARVSGAKAGPAKSLAAEPINAVNLLKALRRRWLAGTLLGLLTAAAAFAAVWYFLPPPQYCASTKFLIPSKPIGTLYDHPEGGGDFAAFEDTQMATIKSQMVVNAALRRVQVGRLKGVPAGVDPVDWLEKQIHVDLPNGKEILRLSIYSDDQETCKTLVTAVSAAYLEEISNETDKRRQDRMDQLKTLAEQYDAKVKRLSQARHDRAKPVGSGNDLTLALKQLEAHEQAVAARHELVEVESHLRTLETEEALAKSRGPASVEISPAAVKDFIDKRPEIAVLREEKAQLDAQISAMKANAVGGEKHPEVRKLIAKAEIMGIQLESERDKLRAECERLLREQAVDADKGKASQLRGEIEKAKAMRTSLLDDIQRLSKEAQDFNEAALELEDLKPELAQAESVAARSTQELEKLAIEKRDPLRVTPWEEVVVTRPDELDRKIKTSGMAAAGAFALAALFIAFLEFRARRVCAPQDVVHGLGMKLVGTVPARPALRRAQRDGHWHALLAESVDASRTMLLHGAGSEAVQVVMIASAVGGEGKTSLAGHLAVSLARSGRKTLLIDGDLRNPAVHRLFDVRSGPGFSELLRGEAQISDVLCETGVAGLHVLTAGNCNPTTLSRLSQDGAQAILPALKEAFDYVILDSSPILPVTDSLLLARHVDGVLFSVLQNVSSMPAVHEAYQRLASLGVVMLGAVVSGIRPDVMSYGRRRYLNMALAGNENTEVGVGQ